MEEQQAVTVLVDHARESKVVEEQQTETVLVDHARESEEAASLSEVAADHSERIVASLAAVAEERSFVLKHLHVYFGGKNTILCGLASH